MSNDGNGSTTPAGATTVNSGASTAISATAFTNYQFSNWSVTAGTGNATIGNASSASTTVVLTGNATVRANFTMNAPVITTPLTNQSCPVNDQVTFTIGATGIISSYAWQKNGSTIGGATSSSYTPPALTVADVSSPATYKCIVSNAGGSAESSASLSVATVTDIDGNVYHQAKIGTQVWMMENLRVTKFNNGTAIPLDTSTDNWPSMTDPKYCYYGNTTNQTLIRDYGALYNGVAVDHGSLAPTGWHVATDAEWGTLVSYLVENAGQKLKESGTSHWNMPNYATNETGFTALPGGKRENGFELMGEWGLWWTSTPQYPFLYYRDMSNQNLDVTGSGSYLFNGLSVRCVKNP
jgi:uncharacterized protein (TIGR02145 family)